MLNSLIQNDKLKVLLMALLIVGAFYGTISLFATIERNKKTFDQIISAFDRVAMSDCDIRHFRMTLTAYANDERCTGYYKVDEKTGRRILISKRHCDGRVSINIKTSTIIKLGYGIVAIDPSMIPLGSIILWGGHKYLAVDKGGDIKGNRIDVWCKTFKKAKIFGRKKNRWITVIIPKWKDRSQLVYYLRKHDKY